MNFAWSLISAILAGLLLGPQDPQDGTAKTAAPQQEPIDPAPPPLLPPEGDHKAMGFIDLDRIEATFRLGLITFSPDYESHTQVSGGLHLQAPSPWLSRDVLGLNSDDLGAFLEVTMSRIDRDLAPTFDDDDLIYFVGAGLDYAIVRDEVWTANAQAGLQYGFFGNVDDTDDGIALILGLTGGVRILQGLQVTVGPQVALADAGDKLYFMNFGIHVDF